MKSITKSLLVAVAVSIGGLEIIAGFEDEVALRNPGRRTTAVMRREEEGEGDWLDSLLEFFVPSARGGELHPTRDDAKIKVEVHLYDSLREVHEACRARGVPWDRMPRPSEPAGCNVFHLDPDPADGLHLCEIFAPRPSLLDDSRTTVLGHEMYHCIAGVYHDR